MTNALSLETILREFDENTEVWMLVDRSNFPFKYLNVPQNDGRQFYRLFMKKEDAEDFLTEILDQNENLRVARILPVKVNLLHTASFILMTDSPYFSVHSPNEVFEYVIASR